LGNRKEFVIDRLMDRYPKKKTNLQFNANISYDIAMKSKVYGKPGDDKPKPRVTWNQD